MVATTRQRTLDALAIFCCGLILFTINLNQQEIIGFEARFYLFAVEMWRHGLSFFPTTYRMPYPDYPVTSTLLIDLFFKLFGQPSKLAAVLPTAIASAITLSITYLIGALTHRRWGLIAVCFMLMTNTFVMEARTISPDQLIAMVTAVCFYLAYSGASVERPKRLYLIPLFFLLGFAIRGPIGLVVPAGVLCVFYVLEKNAKQCVIVSLMAIVVLLLGSAVLFSMAYHVGGMSFVDDVFRMEVSGRLQHAELPLYFYWVESIGAYAVTYPIAILVILGLGRSVFSSNLSPDLKLIQKLLGWALVILIGLSLPAGKKIRYIVAFTPAIALISAYLFILPEKQKVLWVLRRIVYEICYFLPILCMLGLLMLDARFPHSKSIEPIIVSCMVLQTICFVYRNTLVALAVAALTFVMITVFIIEPINLSLNSTQEFVQATETLRHEHHASLVFYQINSDALPIKYVVNMPEEEAPAFLESPAALLQLAPPAMVIVTEDTSKTLPSAVLQRLHKITVGNIGHEPVVVYEKRQ